MDDYDLIVALPWLVFVIGLGIMGWRLAVSRGRRRTMPGQGRPGRTASGGAGAADPSGGSPVQETRGAPGA